MKNSRIIGLTLVFVALFGTYQLGFSAGTKSMPAIDEVTTLSGKTPDGGAPVDFSPFWKAWTLLQQKYVPNGSTSTPLTTTDQDKVWGAIAGLTKSLGDPYTVFFNPEQTQLFETEVNGSFSGVGMEIGIKDNVLTVVAPLKGTPAEAAGIKAGDEIIKIDGKDTTDMSVDEAVQKIRGAEGTTVKLTVYRDKDGLLPDITLTRTTIDIPTGADKSIVLPKAGTDASKSPEAKTAADRAAGIYDIQLYNFGGTAVDTFRTKINSFIDTGSDKLIIDLRGNPGGYLDAAIDIASMFLPKDAVIVKENFGANGGELIHRATGAVLFKKLPKVAILVDGGSASAAEILAAALKENGAATLVGEKTFGKGSVQELVPITSDTALKVTVARWYTPNDESLSNGGIVPDYVVTPTKDDIAAGRDVQFNKAVDVLVNSK